MLFMKELSEILIFLPYILNLFLFFVLQPISYLVLFYFLVKKVERAKINKFLCIVSFFPFLSLLIDSIFIIGKFEIYKDFFGTCFASFMAFGKIEDLSSLFSFIMSFCFYAIHLTSWWLIASYYILYFTRFRNLGLFIYAINLIIMLLLIFNYSYYEFNF